MENIEKINAKQAPKVYYCRHMVPGVVKYDSEMIYVDADGMKRMIPTMAGVPVYVQHQQVDLENIQQADGYVAECFYNELDGWLWAKFIVVSDAGHEAIKNRWSVSNAYLPAEWTARGSHLNVDYERKIVNANFTHLAIVPNPRYEDAAIYTPEEFKEYNARKQATINELHNSKGNKPMFKFFKNEKKEVTSIDADTMVELENGEAVSIGDMVNELKNAKAKKNADGETESKEKAEDEAKEKINMDSEVDVDGETMPLSELINRYRNSMKCNADEKAAKEKAEADEEAKENAKKEQEKKNFNELKNANRNAKPEVVQISLPHTAVERGKSRYGRKQ